MEQKIQKFMEDFVANSDAKTREQYGGEFLRIRVESEEWRDLPEFCCSVGSDPTNATKNRYRDIVPYDYSRVPVHPSIELEDQPEPYVNASFVNGAAGKIAYIAAQGPLLDTVSDFWQMISQYKITVIVMLCKLFELGKIKCQRYWPREGETLDFDGMSISLISEDASIDECTIRSLRLEQTSDDIEKPNVTIINQLHYTDWPDRGSPSTVEPLLDMMDAVRRFQPGSSVPILVHCSAGCGRTGTFCALDYVQSLIKIGKLDENFSIQELVLQLRKQRPAMVQSLDQYALVYRAIAEIFRRRLDLIDSHDYVNWPTDGFIPRIKDKESSTESSSSSNNSPTEPSPEPIAPPRQKRDSFLNEKLPKIEQRRKSESFEDVEPPRIEHFAEIKLEITKDDSQEIEAIPDPKIAELQTEVKMVKIADFTIPDYPFYPNEFPSGPEEMPTSWPTSV